jgi:hypothetical protein
MKRAIENAVFSNRPGRVSGDRLYFGTEFCENLIPSRETVVRRCAAALKDGVKVTFVTPFVTGKGLEKLNDIFEFLNTLDDVEVVFNDWGVFMLLRERYRRVHPVLGRLLSKQRRDPLMKEIFENRPVITERVDVDSGKKYLVLPCKCPEGIAEHYRGSVVNLPIFQQYLLDNNVNRVELDNLAWDMRVETGKLKVSLYVPYGYITTTRACGRLTMTGAPCARECQKRFFKIKDRSLPVPLYAIGNTVFYKSRQPSPEHLRRLGVDRLVLQPRFPF